VELMPEIAKQRDEIKQALRESSPASASTSKRAPKDARLAQQVLTLFNGRNATEVARELEGIGRATVYRKLKQPGRKAEKFVAALLEMRQPLRRVARHGLHHKRPRRARSRDRRFGARGRVAGRKVKFDSFDGLKKRRDYVADQLRADAAPRTGFRFRFTTSRGD
jgi:hypothetical protein